MCRCQWSVTLASKSITRQVIIAYQVGDNEMDRGGEDRGVTYGWILFKPERDKW